VDDVTIQLRLGSVKTYGSELNFSLQVNNSGIGYLQIIASDSDRRRSGTALFLNEFEYGQLKAIINKTEQALEDLRQSGRLTTMRFFPR
jgi:hypothetical protein